MTERVTMSATVEVWRPVVGFEGSYEVSDYGRVRSLDRVIERQYKNGRINFQTRTGIVLKPKSGQYGYPIVDIGGRKRFIHHLVLESFHGPRPEGLVACHENGTRDDNRPANLRWDTQASNIQDMERHGTRRNQNSGKTHCHKRHEFTPENTYLANSGGRHCRMCVAARPKTDASRASGRERQRRYRIRKALEVRA